MRTSLFSSWARFGILLFFLAMFAGVGFFLHNTRLHKERAHFSENLTNLDTAYRASIQMYRLAMDTFFNNTLNKPEILDLLARAASASEAERNPLRGRLYRRLAPVYDLMRRQNLRQLHFHLADGSSFLRFHLPEHYGDSLFTSRPLVELANTEKRVVQGFEIGKSTTGFRYVYPLSLEGRHLGSVELVLTTKAIRDAMAELDPSREYSFLLSRGLADPILFPEQHWLYSEAALHPDFLIEDANAVLDTSPPPLSQTANEINERLKTNPVMRKAMDEGRVWATSITNNGTTYAVSLLPLRDVKQRLAGYLATYSADAVVNRFRQEYYVYLAAVLATMCLVFILVSRLRKQALALDDERRNLQAMNNALAEGVYVQNDQGIIIRVNPAACKILGYSAEELIGQVAHDLFHRHVAHARVPREECPFFLHTQQGLPYDGREVFEDKSGRMITVEVASRPIDESGKRVSSITAFHDITEQVRMDRELQESEFLQRTIMESLPIGMLIIDAETRVIEQVNSAAAAMFGNSEGEMVGRRCHRFMCQAEEHACPIGDLGQTMDNSDRMMIRSDGAMLPVLKTVTTVTIRGQKKFVECLVDIQARKEAENALRKANSQLEQALLRVEKLAEEAKAASKAKSSFLANMSHEIRTPLHGVISMLGLIEESGPTREQREYLDMAETSAESLLAVINDILDFSKIEAGHLELVSQPFDLEKEVHRLTTLLASRAKDKGLELLVRYDPLAPRFVLGDNMRLRQVLSNLMGNALKFTDEGHILLDVRRVFQDAERVGFRFIVEDSGIGIPEDKLGAIFEQFTQVDDSSNRRFGGTGLGLAICRQLVAMMGGDIQVESVLGRGTRFFFELAFPCRVEDQKWRDEPLSLEASRGLVVDDNPINRRICAEFLDAWGVAHDMAESGALALEMLDRCWNEGQRFDFILLDHDMPGMNGLEMAELLRADKRFDSIKLILLTSLWGNITMERLRAVGVCATLPKPVSASDMFETLQNSLLGNGILENPSSVSEPAPSTQDDVARRSVLLVDDHPINRKSAAMVLGRLGCEVRTASNGMEAIDILRENDFDMVFMDVQMPVMDGFEATRAIRAMGGRLARIPIIALTANAMEGDRERCLAVGMTDYLPKPMPKNALRAILSRYEGGTPAEEADEAAVETPEVPALHVEVLLERYDQDLAFAREMVQDFLADTPAILEAVEKALADKNPDIEGLAHRLKGPSSYVAAERINAISARLMHCGREGAWEEAAMLVRELQTAWTAFQEKGLAFIND